jgi:uncharacterized protein
VDAPRVATPYPESPVLRAAILLTISNIFMTLAWYGHLRHMSRALWIVVLVSWGIAFLEYCFQVPANRIGYASGLTAAQLKTMQEVITLVVFAAFAFWYLKEPIRWNTVVGFVLIAAGAAFVYGPWSSPANPIAPRVPAIEAPATGPSDVAD